MTDKELIKDLRWVSGDTCLEAADRLEKMLAVVEAAKPVRDSIMSEVKTVTGTEACDLDDALNALVLEGTSPNE